MNGSNEWYYTRKGEKNGPISAEQLMALQSSGQINADTHVWRVGMREWTPLRDTELATGQVETTPPPLSSHLISNTWVWVIAFLPLILTFADVVISETRFQQYLEQRTTVYFFVTRHDFTGVPWFISSFAFFLSGLIDERILRKAGYSSKYLSLLAMLLSPVYLFVRAKRLKQIPYYGFVFILNVVVAIILQGAT